MHTEEQQNEIKSIVETRGFEFKGIKQVDFLNPPQSRLNFEKDIEGNKIELDVDIPSSSYSLYLNSSSTSTGVHSYEQLKYSLTVALPNGIDSFLRKIAGEDVD